LHLKRVKMNEILCIWKVKFIFEKNIEWSGLKSDKKCHV